MSAPTNHRPPTKGRGKHRDETWRAGHATFVHGPPSPELRTENLPPPTEPRFLRSLNAALLAYPHLETMYIEDWSDDCQIATQPVNRAGAVLRIASEKFDPTDLGSGIVP